MIDGLDAKELEWLSDFFGPPNELILDAIRDGRAMGTEVDQVKMWLRLLFNQRHDTPVILPLVRNGLIESWYATTRGSAGGYELGEDINAWLGPTWLNQFETVPRDTNDPMAIALHKRFGGTVYRFQNTDGLATETITERLRIFASLLEHRPQASDKRARPVGTIRSDFDRAILAGDEAQAKVLITELKQTGRLNEENIRYLDVRLSAGLGLWPQIARDHWLIKTLGDLALPPQILTDLIEALYRTYVDELEVLGDASAMRDAFNHYIANPYPKLFASRRGIRNPRVVKAFLLFERLQPNPDNGIILDLISLLPSRSRTDLFGAFDTTETKDNPPRGSTHPQQSEADAAFDDGQFDRAFEFYLRSDVSKKSIARLLSCVGIIGTSEARDKFILLFDTASKDTKEGLSSHIIAKVDALRGDQVSEIDGYNQADKGTADKSKNPWMAWAENLRFGQNLAALENEVQLAPTNWDASDFYESPQLCRQFADIIGNLNNQPSAIARAAVPQIYSGFFTSDSQAPTSIKPIASLLFLLIAMDETFSRADLDLLLQLTGTLIEMGLSSDEYMTLIKDLEDVQRRADSYTYLPWSLDLCETLALLPCPSNAALDARLRLFLSVLGQASAYAHRLSQFDLVPIEALIRDYGIDLEAMDTLRRDHISAEETSVNRSLDGKTIGLYTLAEAAGSRAKVALEKLFPGCKVTLNSDLVCTAQLSSLAKNSDFFVFAWKSSSHQAFYCIKDALRSGDPIWVPGKGTASILRAVVEHIN